MFAISVDQSMSHFLSNIPRPSRSRVPRSPGATSGKQPLVSSSSPAMVPIPVATVNSSPNVADSLMPAPSQGHSINEDLVASMEPFESFPQMDKGKQPIDEGLQ